MWSESDWPTCHNGVTVTKTKQSLRSPCFLRSLWRNMLDQFLEWSVRVQKNFEEQKLDSEIILGQSRSARGQFSIFVESSEIRRRNEGIFRYYLRFAQLILQNFNSRVHISVKLNTKFWRALKPMPPIKTHEVSLGHSRSFSVNFDKIDKLYVKIQFSRKIVSRSFLVKNQ